MIRIAIVEDAAFDRQVLRDCLREYGQETGTELQITEFTDGSAFLEQYPEDLDLIFMDIMMDGRDQHAPVRRAGLQCRRDGLHCQTRDLYGAEALYGSRGQTAE